MDISVANVSFILHLTAFRIWGNNLQGTRKYIVSQNKRLLQGLYGYNFYRTERSSAIDGCKLNKSYYCDWETLMFNVNWWEDISQGGGGRGQNDILLWNGHFCCTECYYHPLPPPPMAILVDLHWEIICALLQFMMIGTFLRPISAINKIFPIFKTMKKKERLGQQPWRIFYLFPSFSPSIGIYLEMFYLYRRIWD